MSAPIYAIGDIHGQKTMLEDALARIEREAGRDAEIVFLGDLVDRGPDSAGVIDLLQKGVAEGRNWTVLRGNHDRMYSCFMEELPRPDPYLLLGMDWFSERIGGRSTLASYGIATDETSRYFQVHAEAREAIPRVHVDFMAGLPGFHQAGALLFVHAGIRPGVALADQSEDDLCWIRHDFLDHTDPHPWLVVHGHTPQKAPVHEGNRVNLDSGAGYGRPITAAVFEGREVCVLEEKGRRPLRP